MKEYLKDKLATPETYAMQVENLELRVDSSEQKREVISWQALKENIIQRKKHPYNQVSCKKSDWDGW